MQWNKLLDLHFKSRLMQIVPLWLGFFLFLISFGCLFNEKKSCCTYIIRLFMCLINKNQFCINADVHRYTCIDGWWSFFNPIICWWWFFFSFPLYETVKKNFKQLFLLFHTLFFSLLWDFFTNFFIYFFTFSIDILLLFWFENFFMFTHYFLYFFISIFYGIESTLNWLFFLITEKELFSTFFHQKTKEQLKIFTFDVTNLNFFLLLRNCPIELNGIVTSTKYIFTLNDKTKWNRTFNFQKNDKTNN